MKIALVHDYFYVFGGAERVLQALKEIWPQAPVYTAWVDWPWLKQHQPDWQNWQIIPSWFDKLAFKRKLCSPLRFLAPKIWSSFDLSAFDVVISSSAWYMSKGVSLSRKKNSKKPLHICYCHTPPRYLYGYPTAFDYQRSWLIKLYAALINPFLRYYDFNSSQAVDFFIANSREVQQRINKFYRCQAEVIYPPIFSKTKTRTIKTNHQNYFLMVNRLVGPKNVSLAIKICQKLNLALKIVGNGPEEKKLKQQAKTSQLIEFLGDVDDNKLAQLYANCQAVLYLAEQEDFGIIPVEAMSFGKPVIGLNSGGVKESIKPSKTGILINKPYQQNLLKTLKNFNPKLFKASDCLAQAEKFSQARFKQLIKAFVEDKYQKSQ